MASVQGLLEWPLSLARNDLPLVLVTSVIIHAIGTVIYNVYFHPLSKYPGPISAASTNLAYWSATVRGDLLPWVQDIHKKYGEIVRTGPNTLSYTNPEAWKDIYGHRTGGKKSNTKDRFYYPPDFNGRHAINGIANDEEHGRVRRIFSHAFSDKALKEQEQIFESYSDHLVANVRSGVNDKLDIAKLFNCTTMDIMADLTFGEPLGLLDKSEYTPWVAAVFGWIKAADIFRITMEYPFLGLLAKYLTPKSLIEQRKLHFHHSSDRVDRRIERGSDRPDIWNFVLKQPEGRRLDIGDMHANASVFMLAGSETTATLLSGILYFLCKNPDKMKKLRDEVWGSFESDQELTIENLRRLTYMAACIDEALRLYPPLPIGPPREVHPDGNIICGRWVPGQTRVAVAQYTAYRSPLNFKDPESYIPERWLPNTGYENDRREVMQAFAYGPRNCIGKNLAYHELRIILAKMLWNFEFKLRPESDAWINQKCYTLWQKTPLWVEVRAIR
ncbi:Cytochrome p450 protein [Lasiodiplodia theobromae]|uniref:Cytochrome p450 protein n=1 Tax=Lasiodiplodia theobromae TaxID=45133 RepID=UPI0015C3BB44|nr:Cytochrome p450 protein [Lasiodiplodia theobromae]KAF4539469.1 Cytochrome p450 protein [Lasiodiplodia theobromae]